MNAPCILVAHDMSSYLWPPAVLTHDLGCIRKVHVSMDTSCPCVIR